ncbi:MAG: threonine synthase [Chloroflexi bacterium]|nr:threonine synthase [Chloroflexota bacterium]
MRPSYVTQLTCARCGATYPHDRPRNGCACGGATLYEYDLATARAELRPEALPAARGVWRWAPLLPVSDPACQVTLGEGGTPLVALPRAGTAIGLPRLAAKDESLNPTGTFKARGAAVGVGKIGEWGLRDLVLTSSGNAALAWATYARRAGLRMRILTLPDALPVNLRSCVQMGAEVLVIHGPRSEAARIAAEGERAFGWYNCGRESCRIEGKKTIGLEIAADLGWRAPDVIVCPTGGAIAAVGVWKAFAELGALGWVQPPLPRVVVVQPTGCAPIVRAFERGADVVERWESPQSIATGLRNTDPFFGAVALRALRETGGTALAVTDDEIRAAMAALAEHEALSVCPEAAAGYAAAQRLRQSGWLRAEDEVVLVSTASALKYPHLLPEAADVRHVQPGEPLVRE